MDPLEQIKQYATKAQDAAVDLYDVVIEARNMGYTYTDIQEATGLSAGSVTKISRGESPQLTVNWHPGDTELLG